MQISLQKICLVGAVICHKKAGDDACAHLECIKKTGECLHEAGVRLHHLPSFVVSQACQTIPSLVNVSYRRNYFCSVACFVLFRFLFN